MAGACRYIFLLPEAYRGRRRDGFFQVCSEMPLPAPFGGELRPAEETYYRGDVFPPASLPLPGRDFVICILGRAENDLFFCRAEFSFSPFLPTCPCPRPLTPTMQPCLPCPCLLRMLLSRRRHAPPSSPMPHDRCHWLHAFSFLLLPPLLFFCLLPCQVAYPTSEERGFGRIDEYRVLPLGPASQRCLLAMPLSLPRKLPFSIVKKTDRVREPVPACPEIPEFFIYRRKFFF